MMEVEREKKDKLASARKKLNDYKLSRSGTSAGRNSSSIASSQPADVPSFYQNINAPATTFNIFNPAAGNNNFTPLLVPAAVGPAPHGIENSSNGTDQTGHQNANFLTAQQQFPSASSFNQDESTLQFNNPFTSTPVLQQTQEFPVKDFSSQGGGVINSETETTSSALLPLVNNKGTIEHINTETVAHQNEDASLMAVEHSESQVDNVLLFNPSNAAFSPSAPLMDLNDGNTDQISLAGSTCATVASSDLETTQELIQLIDENHSVPSHEEANSENIFAARENSKDTQDMNASSGASGPVFASLLFGASSGETDGIFNISGISQPQPPAIPHETSEYGENSSERNPENNPLVSLVPVINPKVEIDQMSSQREFAATFPTFDGNTEGKSSGNSDPLHFTVASNSVMNAPHQELIPVEPTIFSTTKSSPSTETQANFSAVVAANVQVSSTTNEEPKILVQNQIESSPLTASSMSDEAVQQMRSVQEALELQIEELRRENMYLLGRQTELTSKIEESERLAHEFKLDRDRVREEASTSSQALRGRINSLCEENQRIVKNSTDIGVDLRAKLEEKVTQLEEMQKAVIIVSQSKMEFAGRLDHELERVKELQSLVQEKDDEIQSLRTENNGLREKIKQDHQRDAVIHQLQDQSRHYQVQCDTLQRELSILRNKMKNQHDTSQIKNESISSVSTHLHDNPTGHVNGCLQDRNDSLEINNVNSSLVESTISDEHHSGDCGGHDHQDTSEEIHGTHSGDHKHYHKHDTNEHDHQDQSGAHEHNFQTNDDHHHDHDHSGDNHDHQGHSDDHHHHHHDHSSSDHHPHNHDHSHDSTENAVAHRGQADEMTEMKKTLHRLQWENSSFRNELDVLAVDAKQKKTYEEKCSTLVKENEALKKEIDQLEHVIIQLQGENDTIGDYITLYQTQKMALKECAKEKDLQLELLAREREMLLHRLAELTALVKDLKESKSEVGSQCADDHMHTLDAPIPLSPKKRQIEGKIRDLLTEIGSSSLIENFHPCAVCSGRLMTV